MPKWVLVSGKVRFKKNSSSPSLPSSPTQFKEESGGFWLPINCISSVQFSCSVTSDSLRPHESQHARPPHPSRTPGVYSNTCPSSLWCHPAISSSVIPLLLLPPIPPSIRVFSNESTLRTPNLMFWDFCAALLYQKSNGLEIWFHYSRSPPLAHAFNFALSLKLQCTPLRRSSFMELLTGSKSSHGFIPHQLLHIPPPPKLSAILSSLVCLGCGTAT